MGEGATQISHGGSRRVQIPSPSPNIAGQSAVRSKLAALAAFRAGLGPRALPKQLYNAGALVALTGRVDGVQPVAEGGIRLRVQMAVAVQCETHRSSAASPGSRSEGLPCKASSQGSPTPRPSRWHGSATSALPGCRRSSPMSPRELHGRWATVSLESAKSMDLGIASSHSGQHRGSRRPSDAITCGSAAYRRGERTSVLRPERGASGPHPLAFH
jgi:hypothetical protein